MTTAVFESAPSTGAPIDSEVSLALSPRGSIEVEDSIGYGYGATVAVSINEPTLDIANAAPGEAHLEIPISADVSIVNATPGRNLQEYEFEVLVAYRPADYQTVGVSEIPDDLLTSAHCPDANDLCPLGVIPIQSNAGPVSEGGETMFSVEAPLFFRRHMSEVQANATLALFEQGHRVTLVLRFADGHVVKQCEGLVAYVQEPLSMEYSGDMCPTATTGVATSAAPSTTTTTLAMTTVAAPLVNCEPSDLMGIPHAQIDVMFGREADHVDHKEGLFDRFIWYFGESAQVMITFDDLEGYGNVADWSWHDGSGYRFEHPLPSCPLPLPSEGHPRVPLE